MKEINVQTLEQTAKLAERIAQLLPEPALITLSGDLGAGKTTFTKSLAKAKGVNQVVNSPTFTIMKSYRMADGKDLTHIDAYRLEGSEDELGFSEFFDSGITVIEWPQYLFELEDPDCLAIEIENGPEQERIFKISGKGPLYKKVEEAL